MNRWVIALLLVTMSALPARGQQRPLATEDPEAIGAGRILIEGGFDFAHDTTYTVSGLEGDLWRLGTLGVSVGISSIAELQIDGGLRNRLSISARNDAPLSDLLDIAGDTTSDFEDIVVGTKVRVVSERPGRPGVALRFATRLPNASNESGLGLDTTDFLASFILGKTVESVRVVGNIGIGILADPTVGHRQNDVLTYGLSFARALTNRAEVVGELNGRVSTRSGEPPPGTETRGALMMGARYTTGSYRVDGGVFLGLNAIDPTVGFTAGFTYVFHAFDVY